MSEERVDPRVVRTRASLIEALLGLLSERPLSAITAAELCARAGVSRVAFYDRFGSLDELCIAAMEAELREVRAAAAAIDLGVKRPAWQPPSDLVQVFRLIDEQATLYRAMLGPGGSLAFLSRMRDTLGLAVEASLARFPDWTSWPVRRDDYVNYVTGAVISTIIGWLFEENPRPVDEIARAFWWLLTHRPEVLPRTPEPDIH